MKVLVTCHSFSNFGGIINHTEQLIAGLKDQGHEVEFCFLKPNKVGSDKKFTVDELGEGWELGVGTNLPVHQEDGWKCPFYSILNKGDVNKFVDYANTFDAVIWESIFGFKNKSTEGDTTWLPMVREVTAKQVAIIHDGNLQKLYPWVYHLRDKLEGVACVHPSAYDSADFLGIPRALILNPQDPQIPFWEPVENKTDQVFSLQTFKAWKRVGDVVAAVPHFNTNLVLAGDGIERYYMTSKEKVKEAYIATKDNDPDKPNDRPIWLNAMDTGRFKYIGFVNSQGRDEILQKSKFLIDTSWSKSYGSHFNRVLIDSMRQGVVPIARNLGVSDNEEGTCFLLKPGINYLMIPWDTTPKQFGDYINAFFNISDQEYNKIIRNNLDVIKEFDRTEIADQYINLIENKRHTSNGKTAQFSETQRIDKGLSQKIEKAIDKVWVDFFGIKEEELDVSISLF